MPNTPLRDVWDQKKRDLKLTQKDVAVRMSISQSSVSDYLNGVLDLNIATALQLASILEGDVKEIYDGEVPVPSWSLTDRVDTLTSVERQELMQILLEREERERSGSVEGRLERLEEKINVLQTQVYNLLNLALDIQENVVDKT